MPVKKKPKIKDKSVGGAAKYQEWLTPDGLLCLNAWARDGLDMEQIATKCGVTRETLRRWIKTMPDIAFAVSRGKEPVDIEVENSLHGRCKGYTVQLRKTFKVRRIKYNDKGIKIEEYEELVQGVDEMHIPADTVSMIFWLKNRMPEKWREKREVLTNINLDIEDIAPLAELLKL